MRKHLKKQLASDVNDFRELVFSINSELILKRNGQPQTAYFNSTFQLYMQRVNPAANELIEKYSAYFNSIMLGQFKEILQMIIEQGLSFYYHGLSQSNR